MLIRNKKIFSVGALFAITFLGVLGLIFSPVFNGENGLKYADGSFNRLSKGSSYFIPKVAKTVEQYEGKAFSLGIKLDKPEDVENAAKLLSMAGATVQAEGERLTMEGDLGAVLKSALADADSMFHNDGQAVSGRYGYDERAVMENWWMVLSKMEKAMKKERLVAEAKAVSDVTKKAVEPGYNFYQIKSERVADHAGMMSGLLVFYVVYTMWWGYAIFYMFEGIGLSTKKAKVKKEV